jgi:hypothetical protein
MAVNGLRMDCEWMGMGANGWEWMGMAGNGSESPNSFLPLALTAFFFLGGNNILII